MKFLNNKNNLTPWSNIQMKADKTVELNISGYIGVPEWWQFDYEMEKDLISTKEKMQAELKEISNLKADVIKVNIDSLGGDVNHGQAIYSALAKNPAEIKVEYTGWSASIATIIAAAATDGNIEMSSTNMILIHQGRGCECGVSSSMRAYADMLDKINDTMATVYSEQTGKTKEEMLQLMSVNNGEGEWLTASEAKEKGLIKNIIEPMKAAANYDLSRLSKFGYSIPQNKLKSINMKNPFKKEEAINMVTLSDGTNLLYSDKLEVGTELKGLGENVELKGEHITKDNQKMIVDENNKITSIEAVVVENNTDFDPEAFKAEVRNEVAEAIVEATKPILEALKNIPAGNHKPVKDGGPTNQKQVNSNVQVIARKSVRELVASKTNVDEARK